jgi:hypothetical protein
VTDQPFRYRFDRNGRVIKPKAARTEPKPKPRQRSGTARKYVTHTAESILNACYPGEIPAVVIERALERMAKNDGKKLPRRQP